MKLDVNVTFLLCLQNILYLESVPNLPYLVIQGTKHIILNIFAKNEGLIVADGSFEAYSLCRFN